MLSQNKASLLNSPFLTLIVFYMIMPIVSRLISMYLTTYFYMLVVVFVLMMILCFRPLDSFNHYVILVFPVLMFSLLGFFSRRDSLVIWGYQVLLSILPIAMGYFLITERKEVVFSFAKLIFLLFFITIITTIVGLYRFPGSSRYLAAVVSSQDALMLVLDLNNIGGYNFVYMVVLLYPLLILAYKRRKVNLWIAVIVTGGIFWLLVVAEYSIALLLFLVSSVLWAFKRDFSGKGVVFFAVISIIAVILLSDLFSDFLRWLADGLGSNVFSERLYSLAGGREGLESSDSERIFLYRQSLQTFISKPLLGTFMSGMYGSGGHSQMLDSLAQYGLLGLFLLVMFYRTVYKVFLRPYSRQKGFGYVVWFMVQTMLLSTINTGLWVEVLTLFGPVLIYYIYRKKDKAYENLMDSKHVVKNRRARAHG